MTVEALPRNVAYVGDGETVSFPVPYQFFELRVYVSGAQILTGFSISQPDGAGKKGSVLFDVAPAAGVPIIIKGRTILKQPADYVQGDAFPAESHELVLDRVVMGQQELRADYDANPQLPGEVPEVVPGVNNDTNIYVVIDGVGYLIPAALFLASTNDPSGIGRAHNVGDIVYRAIAEVPAGWIALKAEQQWVEKAEYPEWTSKSEAEGWPYGQTTTLVGIPSIGEGFFRAWSDDTLDPNAAQRRDNEEGVDIVGNVIGSRQASEFKSHTHTKPSVEVTVNSASAGTPSGSITENDPQVNGGLLFLDNTSGGGGIVAGGNVKATGSLGLSFNALPAHAHSASAAVGDLGTTGGSETRPGNVAFQAIMLLRPGDAAAQHATVGLPFLFSDDTADEDPGEGFLCFNNASPDAATELYISNGTVFAADVTSLFSAYANYDVDQIYRGMITVYSAGQLSNSAVYRVIGPPVLEADYVKLPVLFVGGGGSFIDNTPVSVIATFDGRKGVTGDQGEQGNGEAGWSPAFAVENDGARRVLKLDQWIGGGGIAPTDHVGEYVGATGFDADIANGVDIRGPAGASGGGTGTVVGPVSSTIGHIAVFADTDGELIADSGVVVSTDATLASNSDGKLATEKAVKTYIANVLAAGDFAALKGGIDCSANPNYPAADAGDVYKVTVAGKIGGGSGPNVEVGDALFCFVDSSSSGNHATVGANWIIVQSNLGAATTAVSGYVELADLAETDAHSDSGRAVTPAGLANHLKSNAEDQGPITGGAHVTPKDLGNTTGGGTKTIDVSDRCTQLISNTAAFTLDVGTSHKGSTVLIITNGSGAGAVTLTNFASSNGVTKGDAFDTTLGSVFRCTIEYWDTGLKWLFVEKMK